MKRFRNHFMTGDLVQTNEDVTWEDHYQIPEFVRPPVPRGTLGIVSCTEEADVSHYIEITWFNSKNLEPIRYTRLEVERWLKKSIKILSRTHR
jgi:hypothetical protein